MSHDSNTSKRPPLWVVLGLNEILPDELTGVRRRLAAFSLFLDVFAIIAFMLAPGEAVVLAFFAYCVYNLARHA